MTTQNIHGFITEFDCISSLLLNWVGRAGRQQCRVFCSQTFNAINRFVTNL